MPDIKQYLHTLDLVNNKITNLLLNPLTTAQRTTVGGTLGLSDQGYVCYDITLNQQFFWDGTTWVTGLAVPNLQQVTNVGNTVYNLPLDAYSQLLFDSYTIYDNFTSGGGAIGLNVDYGGGQPRLNISDAYGNNTSYLATVISKGVDTFTLPTGASGVITLSVNGQTADSAGAITIPVGTGTVTGVTATSPITSSGGTTPNISTSMNTNKLIGRSTAGVGVMEEITVGTGLSLSAGTLSATVSGGVKTGTASGTDTYTTTISGVSSYTDGDAYLIRFTNGNTTGCTLNINSLGAKDLYKNNDGLLIGGDIQDGGEMLCIYNSTLNGFQVIGTSPNSLISYVTNADSVTITKGQVVYAFGGQGDRMTVKRALNTSDATSAQTVGLVLSTSIAANQKGFIMMQGLLDGLSILPTSTWTDGDPVYLGATAGSITNVKPYAPNHLVYLGFVTTASNGSAGRMYVRVQNGYEMDELHNVQARTPSLKDTLWYDNTVSPAQWKTASIATILGYTPQAQLTLTTTGTSGAATLVGATLNIPQYQAVLTNPVTGTGTTNYLPKWTSSSALGDSVIYETGSNIIIGGTTNAGYKLDVLGGNIRLGSTTSNTLTIGNGMLFDYSSTRSRIYTTNGINITSALTSGSKILIGTIGGSSNVTGSSEVDNAFGDISQTTGTYINTNISGRLLHSSGTSVYNFINVSPTLQTSLGGTYTGTIRGFYYNPTTINAFGGTNIAFENTIGDIVHGNLSGVGTRMVTADSTGKLGVQAIPTGGSGTVTSIATTGPITGGTITTTGTIGITQATTSTDGYLSSTDWNTFNGKFTLPSLTSGSVLFSNGTTIAQDNANFFWDNTNKRLGIGTSSPSYKAQINYSDNLYNEGLRINNTNIGTNALSGVGFMTNTVLGGFMAYQPSNYSNAAQASTMTFSSVGTNKLGFIANANSTPATAQDIFFSTLGNNSTYQMQIKGNTGNVQIGTNTDAGYKLDVNGTGRVTGNFLAANSTIASSVNATLTQVLGGVNSSSPAQYKTTNAGSNVTPQLAADNMSGVFGQVSGYVDRFNGFSLAAVNTSYNVVTRGGINITNLTNTAGSESGDLAFLTQSGGTAMSEKMRIFAGGNVAIGTTTNSGYKLDVNGTGRFSGDLTSTGNITAGSSGNVTGNAGIFGQSSNSFVVIGFYGGSQPTYYTTNASASAISMNFAYNSSFSISGRGTPMIEEYQSGWAVNNSASKRILRATIGVTNLGNTAGSESADLIFGTQSGGTAVSEKLRITSVGAIAVNGAANTGTSGQVLTSAGSGAPPTWTTVSGGGGVTTGDAIAYAIALG